MDTDGQDLLKVRNSLFVQPQPDKDIKVQVNKQIGSDIYITAADAGFGDPIVRCFNFDLK